MNYFQQDLLKKLNDRSASIAVIGLGYVGRPLFQALSKLYSVIGFDNNEELIENLRSTNEFKAHLTNKGEELTNVDVFIVCVPTDIHPDKSPDLTHLEASTQLIGRGLRPGSVIIYESTVYPGCTEEICLPILEEQSRYTVNKEFWVGYAPERIVPGVSDRGVEDVPRVVGGSNADCAEFLVRFYSTFVRAPIHKASSIRVAEASKIVENIQRDLNISLMNELAIIFDKMHIDTQEVLDAAATKWNFHPYSPGLVGGHCISVDPFYLLHKARALGIEPDVIAAGRAINDYLPIYICEKLEATLAQSGKSIAGSRILIFGATFKENIDDIRNSKVVDLIRHLEHKNGIVSVMDPHISKEKATDHQITLRSNDPTEAKYDALILAVKHDEFLQHSPAYFSDLLNEPKILFDLKRMIYAPDREKFAYWAL